MSQPLTPLDQKVRSHIAQHGSIAYVDLVEWALYDPDYGFYATHGHAGRRGDFITSPEVGPLFGAVLARALDSEWRRLGEPDNFVVTEFGAGPGTLARSILYAEPDCLAALRYRTVERSATQRANHPPGIEALEFVPEDVVTGVILANELLDNLPFTPVELADDRWYEVQVTVEGTVLVEILEPASAVIDAYCQRAFPEVGDGRYFMQPEVVTWVDQAKALLSEGRIVAFDYVRQQSHEVEVRTYSEHQRGDDPLARLGMSDITVDVDLCQLEAVTGPVGFMASQSEWLGVHGIETLVEEGRRAWVDGAAQGGLAALRGRSRVREAEALTDSSGLGSFSVLEWQV